MPYDELGNYYSGEEPDLEQMRYALASQKFPLKSDNPQVRNRAGQVVRNPNDMIPGAVEGLGNTLSGAARGSLATTLGAPVDITTMLMRPFGYSVEAPVGGSEYFKEHLPFAPTSHEGKVAQELGSYLPTPGNVGEAVNTVSQGAKKAGQEIGQALHQAHTTGEGPLAFVAAGGIGPMYVIKPKGGNWLKGNVEDLTMPHKYVSLQEDAVRAVMMANPNLTLEQAKAFVGQEHLSHRTAVNNWIDKKLNNYIKNEMGTEGDPLRKSIEEWNVKKDALLAQKDKQIDKAVADMEKARQSRGYTPEMMTKSQEQIRALKKERDLIKNKTGSHLTEEQLLDQWVPEELSQNRRKAGMPASGHALDPSASGWEDRADSAIDTYKAEEILKELAIAKETGHEWLNTVDPKTLVYHIDSFHGRGKTDFGHLIDELKNAVTPDTAFGSLPAHLKIDPKKLEKMTVAQVADHVDNINAWRAAQRAEANAAMAANEATVPVKKYEGKNIGWSELRIPEMAEDFKVPERYEVRQLDSKTFSMSSNNFEPNQFAIWDREKGKYIATGSNSEKDALKQIHKMVNQEALKKAMKYEGDQLSHCISGEDYFRKALNGDGRYYSLRDAEGQPHVTVETVPSPIRSWDELTNAIGAERAAELWKEFDDAVGYNTRYPDRTFTQFLIDKGIQNNMQKVAQIKGYRNGPPKAKDKPFVLDFLNSGNFTSVNKKDLEQAKILDSKDRDSLKSFAYRYDTDKFSINEFFDQTPNLPRFLDYDEVLKHVSGKPKLKTGGRVTKPTVDGMKYALLRGK